MKRARRIEGTNWHRKLGNITTQSQSTKTNGTTRSAARAPSPAASFSQLGVLEAVALAVAEVVPPAASNPVEVAW